MRNLLVVLSLFVVSASALAADVTPTLGQGSKIWINKDITFIGDGVAQSPYGYSLSYVARSSQPGTLKAASLVDLSNDLSPDECGITLGTSLTIAKGTKITLGAGGRYISGVSLMSNTSYLDTGSQEAVTFSISCGSPITSELIKATFGDKLVKVLIMKNLEIVTPEQIRTDARY